MTHPNTSNGSMEHNPTSTPSNSRCAGPAVLLDTPTSAEIASSRINASSVEYAAFNRPKTAENTESVTAWRSVSPRGGGREAKRRCWGARRREKAWKNAGMSRAGVASMEFGRIRRTERGMESAKRGSNPRDWALWMRRRRRNCCVVWSHCLWQQSTPSRIEIHSNAASSRAFPFNSSRTAEASGLFFASAGNEESRKANMAGRRRFTAGLANKAALSCINGSSKAAQTRIFSAVQAFRAVEAKNKYACSDMLTPTSHSSPAGTLVQRGGVAKQRENRGDLDSELGIGDSPQNHRGFPHFLEVFELVLQAFLRAGERSAGFAGELRHGVAERDIRGTEQCFEVTLALHRLQTAAVARQFRPSRKRPQIPQKPDQSGKAGDVSEGLRVGLRLLLDQIARDVHERLREPSGRLRERRGQRKKVGRFLEGGPIGAHHFGFLVRFEGGEGGDAVVELGVRRGTRGDLSEDGAELGGDGMEGNEGVEKAEKHEENGLVGDTAGYRGERGSQGDGGEREIARSLGAHEGKSARVALLLRFEEAFRGGALLGSGEERADEAVDEGEAGRKGFRSVLDERNLLADQEEQTVFHVRRKAEFVVGSAHEGELWNVGFEYGGLCSISSHTRTSIAFASFIRDWNWVKYSERSCASASALSNEIGSDT